MILINLDQSLVVSKMHRLLYYRKLIEGITEGNMLEPIEGLIKSSSLGMSEILPEELFVQTSQQITHIQAYIRTQKRTRSYMEEYLHGTKWPIDRPTNTADDTDTASAEASADAPDDALVDAPT